MESVDTIERFLACSDDGKLVPTRLCQTKMCDITNHRTCQPDYNLPSLVGTCAQIAWLHEPEGPVARLSTAFLSLQAF